MDRRQGVDDQGARGVRAPGGRTGCARSSASRSCSTARTSARCRTRSSTSTRSRSPGPTTERFQALAAELGLVMVLPMYEQEQPGVLFNTAAVVDADGTYLGKYRKTHIPQVKGFWEKFYFRPGNLGFPVFDTAVGRSASTSATTATSPRAGARSASTARRSCSTRRRRRGACRVPVEARTAGVRRCERVLHRRDQPRRHRRPRRQRLLRHELLRRSRGKFVGDAGDGNEAELIVRDLDMDLLAEVRNRWAFYRDRRPDVYDGLVQP